MILPDTTVWIDYFNGKRNWQTDTLDRLLKTEIVVIGDIIISEILQGIRDDLQFENVKNLLLGMNYRDMFGQKIALKAASNYRRLRKNGVTPRKSIDVWIATYCIENNLILLEKDRDFAPMEKWLQLKTYPKPH